MQEKEFMRLGGVETLTADARIIAATNANLEQEVADGNFREDLYYRLNVINVKLPPLRDRAEDIPLLTRHFLTRFVAENDKRVSDITPEAMQLLMDYRWPGNVRELENVIERAVVLSTGDVLDVGLLPPTVREPHAPSSARVELPSNGYSLKDAVSSYERQLIIKALDTAGGVQKRAAELLKVKPTTLHEMMKRLEITTERS
jgi:DNA-binding NtrC family response regulator